MNIDHPLIKKLVGHKIVRLADDTQHWDEVKCYAKTTPLEEIQREWKTSAAVNQLFQDTAGRECKIQENIIVDEE